MCVAGGACGGLSCRVLACWFLCFWDDEVLVGYRRERGCVMIVRPFVFYYFPFLLGEVLMLGVCFGGEVGWDDAGFWEDGAK